MCQWNWNRFPLVPTRPCDIFLIEVLNLFTLSPTPWRRWLLANPKQVEVLAQWFPVTPSWLNTTLKSFEHLKLQFNLSNSYLFRCLSVHHAYFSQLGASPLTLFSSEMETLPRDPNLRKPLSNIYQGPPTFSTYSVSSAYNPNGGRRCWTWMMRTGKRVGNYTFLQLVSASGRLIQLMILHRIYFTSSRLHRVLVFPLPAGDVGASRLFI